MADISENNKVYLKQIIASGEGVVPALVYAKLRDAGLVTKVEGKSGGRGKTVVTITDAGRLEVI